ncbi:MAG TPA: DUF2924 domain-containing protein [Planctomycetota bacterium]|nr:DUF2924 domain-containing protein [Planctomycetota bacterium]
MAAKEKSVLGVIGEVARLKTMTAVSLRKRYDELCPGQEPRSNNHAYLLKKIAAKLQEQPGLEKSGETAVTTPSNRDPRLPQVGAIITKTFKGRELKVLVAADGFEFEGTRYRSLSAIARKVSGTPWNGFLFFNLIPNGKAK